MKTVNTLSNQQLIDIAMQELGDVERVFELCLLNDLSLTDSIAPGAILFISDFEFDKRRIVSLFSRKELSPASEDDAEEDLLLADPVNASIMPATVDTGKVLVLTSQALIDIAMQELGDVERVFELCLKNDLSLTDLLLPGMFIQVPDYARAKRSLVNLFKNKSIAPASDAEDAFVYPQLPPGGIGYMGIEYTFIVS